MLSCFENFITFAELVFVCALQEENHIVIF